MNCVDCNKEFEPTHGRQKYCSAFCGRRFARIRWRSLNKEKDALDKHIYNLKYKYGINQDFYNRMFEEQKGCCKICSRHQTEIKKRLDIDHNHETKEIRGLLCNRCNQALGLLKENPEFIKSMLIYIGGVN